MITRTRLIELKMLLFIALAGVTGMAHSVEEPQYEVLQSIDGVEIRQYQATVQAVTILPGSSDTSEGFRRLAGFIFGGNNKEQKIAMTAPVRETLGENSPQMHGLRCASRRRESCRLLPTSHRDTEQASFLPW